MAGRFVWDTDEVDVEEVDDDGVGADEDEGETVEVEERFNPLQKRDEHGRWTDGGSADPSISPGGDYVGRRRRADTTGGGGAGGGMPSTIASAAVRLSGGGTLTMSRHADGGTSFDGRDPYTPEQTRRLLDTLSLADDWDPGDTETIPGVGTITRQRSGMRLDFEDGGTTTVSARDANRLEHEHEQLGRAVRMETGSGPLDVFPDGKKIAFRQMGGNGTPVEVAFNRSSAQKINRAVDAIIDDIDDPDTPDKAVRIKTVTTNAGKVNVQLTGDWRNGTLTITPADGDNWGVVIDGPSHQAWANAMGGFLDESAPTATGSDLAEQVPLTEAAGAPLKGRRKFRARLIKGDTQGSSGYYPARMLAEYAHVFPAGLPMYIDHPSLTEQHDRPERSFKDLAGKLVSAARYDGDGLYADIEVYPHWADVVEAMWEDTGISIRASGTVEASSSPDIRGPIVTSLAAAESVDFVTAAGAGGKLVALLESARSRAPEYLRRAAEAHLEEAISDQAWGDVSQSDYTIEQWRKACLIGPSEPSEVKGDYKLPVRMPNGDLNRNAVHAAAARIGQTDAAPAVKRAAARKLIRLYGELDEDPPESLRELAGDEVEEGKVPPQLAKFVKKKDDEPDDEDDDEDDTDSDDGRDEDDDDMPAFLKRKINAREARNVGHWLESRIHRLFTEIADEMFGDGRLSRDERIALSSAIGEGLTAFNAKVADEVPHLYERDLFDDPSAMTATQEPGIPPADNTKEGEVGMPELTEAQARELEEARTTAETAKEQALAEAAAAKKAAEEAQMALARFTALEEARPIATRLLAESSLPAAAQTRLLASVTADSVPLTDERKLDEAALTTSVQESIKGEETYLASLEEAAGAGQVRGLGESQTAQPAHDPAAVTALEETYRSRGLSPEAAKLAALGRP